MTTLAVPELEKINLREGGHPSRFDGLCALEAVAWLAGEKHTDHPECVCPVIADFVRRWNDGLPTDEDRNRLLKPLLPELIGSRSTAEVELQRYRLITLWLTKQATPAALTLAGYPEAAAQLQADPDPSAETIRSAAVEVSKKWDAAWAAAWAAARAAAWDAAWDAAWAAAWDAARDAAWAAAWDAARDAARAAARAAAWAAARDAAWAAQQNGGDPAAAARAALAPLVEQQQQSAVALIRELIAVKPVEQVS